MKVYEFTLIISKIDDSTADSVYNKCKDASLGSCGTTTYVAFDREADSLEYAIDTAITDLLSLGVTPIRIEMEIPAAVS